ncbi:hypothetical protein PVAP13_7KG341600 [Panicum virgatum]|uniref:Uncharacterized protein n=1 Tax=Panicum virgatum TaxID=38727 RepID=A0A8T0QLH7_PANVG|nr:hypothetical protein PVAP13_7KG341600 [Panicum virgatum]
MDADPHRAEIIRTIFHVHSHPELRNNLDWGIVRHRAGEMVRYLIKQAPELTHLLRLPRCPIYPCCTIPFGAGLGTRRRRQAKNTGRMPASLLALRFRPKERSPLARDLGLSHYPMAWLETMIDEALVDGEKEKVEDHSLEYSCGERITGAPVAPSPGEKKGITSSNSGTKRVSQQDCYSGSVGDAKRPRTTEEFCQGQRRPTLKVVKLLKLMWKALWCRL